MNWKAFQDVYYVFWREMKRFWLQKTRIIMAVVQPVIWLGLMGNMMSGFTKNPMAAAMLGTRNYLSFMTPGIIIMTTLFGGVFGGMTIIWDRRLGILHKMLAAPIPRSAIPLGKMLASAVQNTIQVVIIVLVARLLGVSFVTGVPGILLAIGIAGIFGLIMSSVSLALAARIKSHEALFAVVNFLTMPLMFTSNAMFPTKAMPDWLATIARYNPLSHAVAPIRTLVNDGWLWADIGRGVFWIGLFALILIAVAIGQFRRTVA